MIVLPNSSNKIVMKAIQDNEARVATDEEARIGVAIDHYQHNVVKLRLDVEKYFKSKIDKAVPMFVQKVVPRFAKARVIIYKKPPKRRISEVGDSNVYNELYAKYTYNLDVQQKVFAEMTWVLGKCLMFSYWNDLKKRVEYKIVGRFNEYYLKNDSINVWGISFETTKRADGTRRFIFWSEERDGKPGDSYIMDEKGVIEKDPKNKDMANPYGILPFTIAKHETNAFDVVDAALAINIAFTRLNLGIRNSLGLLWTDADLDELLEDKGEDGKEDINWDELNILEVPDGRKVESLIRGGKLGEIIDGIRAIYNITASNNNMRIKFEEKSIGMMSGSALRILENESNDSLAMEIPFWLLKESERYTNDRVIIKKEIGKELPEKINVNFASIDTGLTEVELQKIWDWKFEHGGTIRDYYMESDPDMDPVEMEKRIKNGEELLEIKRNIDVEVTEGILASRKARTAEKLEELNK